MSSKHGVLVYKTVTSDQVGLNRIELPNLSEEVRQIIRDSKLESLTGLLGPDSQRLARQLVEGYWRTKPRRLTDVSKINQLRLSSILACSISLVSLFLGLGEAAGLLKIAHPLFWFPITVGAFGIAGSNYLYLRRLWNK